jgi:hypothetical protein
MAVEEEVKFLTSWACETRLGAADADDTCKEILAGIQKLRDRIDELGGYHDDV